MAPEHIDFPPELTVHVNRIRASLRWAVPNIVTSDTFYVT